MCLGIQILSLSLLGDRSSIHKKLRVIASSIARRKPLEKEGFHPVKLYHLGQSLALSFDKKFALSYFWRALRLSLKGQASPDALLRTFGDLGLVLGYLGFRKIAYYLVDETLTISREAGYFRTYSYLQAMRTLTLDHFQGKFEDYDGQINEAKSLF